MAFESLTVGGTAFMCLPWPKPKIIPAIDWVRNSAGNLRGSDRGVAQDLYETTVQFKDTETIINSLETVLQANREGITLSAFAFPAFAPTVDHTGSISAAVLDFGVIKQESFSSSNTNLLTLEVKFRAISPTILASPSASLSGLALQQGWEAGREVTAHPEFTYTQATTYKDHNRDIGTFRGQFLQTTATLQAIIRYLMVTARASAFTLPTFSGVTYPFGVPKGSGAFSCKAREFSFSRKNLNRWDMEISFSEEA